MYSNLGNSGEDLYFRKLLSKGAGVGEHDKRSCFKPEMQSYGVLSQCTIIHPGRFRRTFGNSFIYLLFVCLIVFIKSP